MNTSVSSGAPGNQSDVEDDTTHHAYGQSPIWQQPSNGASRPDNPPPFHGPPVGHGRIVESPYPRKNSRKSSNKSSYNSGTSAQVEHAVHWAPFNGDASARASHSEGNEADAVLAWSGITYR